MLKLFNQKCLALHPLKTRLIAGFLRQPGLAAHSTAASRTEKIREVEEKHGISWKSTCLPLSPEISHKIDSDHTLQLDLHFLSRSVEPEYPNVSSSESLQPGDVSLSSLFGTGGYLVRNNGDRVDLDADTFKSKFVFVCCFHAPPDLDAQFITNVCDELYSSRKDVEVVMAAWMNSLVDGDDHKQVLDHFFSAFPKSCLAVPFEDSKRRAHVCRLVADYTRCKLDDFPCLVLDTEGMVLPPFIAQNIRSYGAAAFPFTPEVLEGIKARDEQLQKCSSLEQLLLINTSSPDVVYKFNPEGGPREEVSISELNDKLVGLYMPGQCGHLLPTLVDIYEQCMKKQLEFEVVVAYSRHDYSDLHDQKLHQEKIDRLLRDHDICRQWWCLPLNNSVSARLCRLYGRFTVNDLWVVGPAGGFIDVYAPGKVMEMYGVDGYPFTREAIIQRQVSKMREITLESVLLGDGFFRGTDRDDIACAEKLLGRKISVLFGSLSYVWDLEGVLSSYHEMKAKDPGFEVVFVYAKNDRDRVELVNQATCVMPWYVCSFDLNRLQSMREKLGLVGAAKKHAFVGASKKHAFVGFGEDGRVRSCRTEISASFTLDDTLYKDVSIRRRMDLPCNPKDHA